jgi:hypothetical protein
MNWRPTIHKRNLNSASPLVSLVLLDWSVRERFHALDWLSKQTVQRELYEIIWVELYDRVIPEAFEKADVLVTLHQEGIYHKHVGYNAGLVLARGAVVTICDSDAVFPTDFAASIIKMFELNQTGEPRSLVLMHYEWRSASTYPENLLSVDELPNYTWLDLWPNVGACMSVRCKDAISFGGFDEHRSFRGYMCGPYDLAWRLINAGIPEIWHDPSVALWHFAHPDPTGTTRPFSMELWKEITNSHIDGHALTAVEAFSTGRTWVLKENREVHRRRMEQRVVGTEFEKKYAAISLKHFSCWGRFKLRTAITLEPFRRRWLESSSRVLRGLWIIARGTRNLLRQLVRMASKPIRDLIAWIKNSIKVP